MHAQRSGRGLVSACMNCQKERELNVHPWVSGTCVAFRHAPRGIMFRDALLTPTRFDEAGFRCAATSSDVISLTLHEVLEGFVKRRKVARFVGQEARLPEGSVSSYHYGTAERVRYLVGRPCAECWINCVNQLFKALVPGLFCENDRTLRAPWATCSITRPANVLQMMRQRYWRRFDIGNVLCWGCDRLCA